MSAVKKSRIKYILGIIIITLIATILNMRFAYNESLRIEEENNLKYTKTISQTIEKFINEQVNQNRISAEIFSNFNFENISFANLYDDFKMKKYYFGDIDLSDIPVGEIKSIDRIIENNDAGNLINDIGYIDINGKIISLKNKKNEVECLKKLQSQIFNTKYSDYVSNIFKTDNHKYIFFIVTPILSNENTVKGYVYRSIDTYWLYSDIVDNWENFDKTNYFFIDDKGTLIYSRRARQNGENIENIYRYESLLKNEFSEINDIYSGKEGSITTSFNKDYRHKIGLDDEKSLLSVSPVFIQGKYIMSVCTTITIKNFMSHIGNYLQNQVIIFICCIVALVYFVYKNYKNFVQYEKQKSYYEAKIEDQKKIKTLNEEVNKSQYEIIKSMVKFIELKDSYTAGHSERVTEYAVGLAEFLNLSKKEIRSVKYASILHDIGKIGIDENVLNKSERLTEEEFNIIKQHPLIGYEALKDMTFLNKEIDAVLHHHERLDGKGYPHGLKGEEISLYCRILSISDSFDAMTSNRIYRRKLSIQQAVEELKRNSGTQFDKELVIKFIEFIKNNYTEDLAPTNNNNSKILRRTV